MDKEKTGSVMQSRGRNALRWILIVTISVICVVALRAADMPAAVLLGCMIGAIAVSVGGRARPPVVPVNLFQAAQGVVGCLIARSMRPELLPTALAHWPLFLFSVLAVVAVAGTLGWLLMRCRVLPGTTAVWGLTPGGATAMTILADAYDADGRLVAFMQYLRVMIVTLAASLISHWWVTSTPVSPSAMSWFPPLDWGPFAATLALALAGPIVARRLRLPAGALLLPMALGIVLQGAGLFTIELPPALLAVAYAIIGWGIGLRFDRPILRHAAQAFPRVLASIVALIVVCMGFAAVLVYGVGVDPLTAYLATSPGGADSVAIIAASSNVDLPFVMSMQMTRFLVVLIIGPRLARFIAQRSAGA